MKERVVVALRVLTAIQEHGVPIQSDIESLLSWVDSLDRNADPDELACMVITAELQRRKNVRIMRGVAA
jgi:hypothetical protein